MHLTDDNIDDAPQVERAGPFNGVDMATDPATLPPEIAAAATNCRLEGDGTARQRPAFRLNSNVAASLGGLGLASYAIRGIGYYDTPNREATLIVVEDRLVEVNSVADNVTASIIGTFSPAGSGIVHFEQLIDRMFWLAGGKVYWAIYSGGAWTMGSTVAFSDGSAMPSWGKIASQGFRLLLMEAEGYKLYTSAVGQAHLNTDWVKTDNVRVGSGQGDPARMVVAGQAGYVTMLNARSVYQLDISAAAVASWSSLRVSGLIGCVEGKTAVTIGQDVLFLCRHGVVSLGALAVSDSISPQAMLSAPMRPVIDRINWSAITTAWAVAWRDFYVLALPLDSNTSPRHFIVYNTRTKLWCGTWDMSAAWLAQANTLPGPGSTTFTGFAQGCVVNFGDKAETVIGDNTGRLFYLHADSYLDYYLAASSVGAVPTLQSRLMTWGAPDSNKQLLQLEVETYATNDSLATTTVAGVDTDGSPANRGTRTGLGNSTAASAALTWRDRLLLRGTQRVRAASITITGNGGPLNVRRVTLSAFVDPAGYT